MQALQLVLLQRTADEDTRLNRDLLLAPVRHRVVVELALLLLHVVRLRAERLFADRIVYVRIHLHVAL